MESLQMLEEAFRDLHAYLRRHRWCRVRHASKHLRQRLEDWQSWLSRLFLDLPPTAEGFELCFVLRRETPQPGEQLTVLDCVPGCSVFRLPDTGMPDVALDALTGAD